MPARTDEQTNMWKLHQMGMRLGRMLLNIGLEDALPIR